MSDAQCEDTIPKHINLLNAIRRIEEVGNGLYRLIDQINPRPVEPPTAEKVKEKNEPNLHEFLLSTSDYIHTKVDKALIQIEEIRSLLF